MTLRVNGLIVVPVYNEGSRLPLQVYTTFLEHHADSCILFVNDGSTDNTMTVLRTLAAQFPAQVVIESLPANVGKAEAVRTGVVWAGRQGCGMVAYLDADLAAPLETAALLFDELGADPALRCVIGSRIKLLGWHVQRSELRHYLGRIFATAASVTLDLPVYDTQCGAKALRLDDSMLDLLEAPFLSRWLFDVELIARIRDQSGAQAMRELPLPTWIDTGGSSLNVLDYLKAPWELWRIRRRHPPGPARARADAR